MKNEEIKGFWVPPKLIHIHKRRHRDPDAIPPLIHQGGCVIRSVYLHNNFATW